MGAEGQNGLRRDKKRNQIRQRHKMRCSKYEENKVEGISEPVGYSHGSKMHGSISGKKRSTKLRRNSHDEKLRSLLKFSQLLVTRKDEVPH